VKIARSGATMKRYLVGLEIALAKDVPAQESGRSCLYSLALESWVNPVRSSASSGLLLRMAESPSTEGR
jgi:hypothetical protein